MFVISNDYGGLWIGDNKDATLYKTDKQKDEYIKQVCKQIIDDDIGSISDGYHTFDELYDHRAILTALAFNAHKDIAWKSKQHHNPDEPMYDGMFICGIETPDGQATYHYDIEPYWDLFHVKELECAPEWDGHTPAEALKRLESLLNE